MPTQRRRIVPDTSVMIAAYFHEEFGDSGINLTRRAIPLVNALRLKKVKAFAPELLWSEFVSVAHRKAYGQSRSAEVTPELALGHIRSFLDLSITPVRNARLVEEAWGYSTKYQISAPDSFPLACAIRHDAELWIAAPSKDNFEKNARSAGADVHLLTEGA